MAQATLSSASVIQDNADGVRGGPSALGFNAQCQPGSTVTIELCTQGVAFFDFAPGYSGNVPDGFELDSCVTVAAGTQIKFLYCFRKPNVAAGEQTWNFNSAAAPLEWVYRATEWNADLEPVSPCEGFNGNQYTEPTTPAPPATFSTGTAPSWGNTNRANTVALGFHLFYEAVTTAGTFGWSNLTNGFTDRGGALTAFTNTGFQRRYWCLWSWKFAQAVGQYETTATATRGGAASGDSYASLITLYAATTYA